jgi:hypothetical protein
MISTPTPPVPSFVHGDDFTFHSLSLSAIPTIVVLSPESSIIGLYGGPCESTQELTRELPTSDPQAPKDVPEIDFDEHDTDVGGGSPESEFEIITVPALKVRLEDISEANEIDVESAFGSLMVCPPRVIALHPNRLFSDPGIHSVCEF